MKVSELIANHVRGQISDNVASYTWENAVILNYVNDGRRQIKSDHPEAFHVTSIVIGPVVDLASDNDDLGMTPDFILPLSHFVCHRILAENSEDADNMKLSQWHFDHFLKGLIV